MNYTNRVGMCLFCMGLAMIPSSACSAKKQTVTWFVDASNAWKTVAERFERDNPDIRVQIVGSVNQDKFYAMATAGLMPDVWGPWGTLGIKADVNRNWALDITPYIKRDGKAMDIDDFFPGLMREFRVNGKFYSLPIFSYVDYFFYNTDMYAQAGLQPPPSDANDKSWNWDAMVRNALKTTKTGANGRINVAGIDFGRLIGAYPNWLHLWDARIYTKETLATSVPKNIHWNSKESVNALTKVWELIHKYKVARPEGDGFDRGAVASNINWGWSIGSNMVNTKLKWAIAPLPWAVTNSGTLWPDGWRIAKVSKNKEAAWRFVKYLCGKENMRFLASQQRLGYSGSPMARKSIFAESLGKNIGKATGMDPATVFKIHSQGDEAGVVKYGETVCLHIDLSPFAETHLNSMFRNQLSPAQAANNIQGVVDRQLPVLYKRWVRNIDFSGAEKHL